MHVSVCASPEVVPLYLFDVLLHVCHCCLAACMLLLCLQVCLAVCACIWIAQDSDLSKPTLSLLNYNHWLLHAVIMSAVNTLVGARSYSFGC